MKLRRGCCVWTQWGCSVAEEVIQNRGIIRIHLYGEKLHSCKNVGLQSPSPPPSTSYEGITKGWNLVNLSLVNLVENTVHVCMDKILANDSQFAKILSNQNLPLKYFECRAEVIHQFVTANSLVGILSPKFHPSNISPCRYHMVLIFDLTMEILMNQHLRIFVKWNILMKSWTIQLLLIFGRENFNKSTSWQFNIQKPGVYKLNYCNN